MNLLFYVIFVSWAALESCCVMYERTNYTFGNLNPNLNFIRAGGGVVGPDYKLETQCEIRGSTVISLWGNQRRSPIDPKVNADFRLPALTWPSKTSDPQKCTRELLSRKSISLCRNRFPSVRFRFGFCLKYRFLDECDSARNISVGMCLLPTDSASCTCTYGPCVEATGL